jgi:hypothetical protein
LYGCEYSFNVLDAKAEPITREVITVIGSQIISKGAALYVLVPQRIEKYSAKQKPLYINKRYYGSHVDCRYGIDHD